MKFLSKISIFLLSAAIFMSALVVYAENESTQAPEWPYLQFSINISEENQFTDNDLQSLMDRIPDAVSAPFFALTRDYPDITMWASAFTVRPVYQNKPTYKLTGLNYTVVGYTNYGDPSGMYKQLRKVVDNFEPSGNTRYDKLMSIHDFICKMTTYVMGAPYCYSAYGALVNRRSVCEGYAEAFKLLCDKEGIDCILVTGMAHADPNKDREKHMWNLVRMDDGKWYGVDVTWDDAGDIAGNYDYFLVGSETVRRNLKFSQSHNATYDFAEIDGSDKTISTLEYPTLSEVAYVNGINQTANASDDEPFHYSFLNDLQKELYDKMLQEIVSKMPSNSEKTPTPASTDDMVAPPPSTTKPPATTPIETTTVKESTSPEATTTVSDTTVPHETTTAGETTTVEETTAVEQTTAVITTAPVNTTDTPPTTTVVTSVTETDPVDTTPSATTEPSVSSSASETDPPISDTEENSDTAVSDTVGDTTNSITSSQNQDAKSNEMQKMYKIVTVVVITSAIICLSVTLGIVVIRYAKKHKN